MNEKNGLKHKTPQIKIDKKLNKLDGQLLFPEKLAKANEILRTTDLPVFVKRRPIKSSAKVSPALKS